MRETCWSFDSINSCKRLNSWELAVYMSYTSQNFRLFHVSNLSVLNFRIVCLCIRGRRSIREMSVTWSDVVFVSLTYCFSRSLMWKTLLWSVTWPVTWFVIWFVWLVVWFVTRPLPVTWLPSPTSDWFATTARSKPDLCKQRTPFHPPSILLSDEKEAASGG